MSANSRAGRSAQHAGEPLLAFRGESSHALHHGGAGPGGCDTIENVGCGRLRRRSGRAHGNLPSQCPAKPEPARRAPPIPGSGLKRLQHEEASGDGKLVAAGRVGAHDEAGRCAEQAALAVRQSQAFGLPEQGRGEKFQGVVERIVETVEVIVTAEDGGVAPQPRVESANGPSRYSRILRRRRGCSLRALGQSLIEGNFASRKSSSFAMGARPAASLARRTAASLGLPAPAAPGEAQPDATAARNRAAHAGFAQQTLFILAVSARGGGLRPQTMRSAAKVA